MADTKTVLLNDIKDAGKLLKEVRTQIIAAKAILEGLPRSASTYYRNNMAAMDQLSQEALTHYTTLTNKQANFAGIDITRVFKVLIALSRSFPEEMLMDNMVINEADYPDELPRNIFKAQKGVARLIPMFLAFSRRYQANVADIKKQQARLRRAITLALTDLVMKGIFPNFAGKKPGESNKNLLYAYADVNRAIQLVGDSAAFYSALDVAGVHIKQSEHPKATIWVDKLRKISRLHDMMMEMV